MRGVQWAVPTAGPPAVTTPHTVTASQAQHREADHHNDRASDVQPGAWVTTALRLLLQR
eukprot:gene10331-5779_t